jgi:ArsR family transcriptional regulator
MNRDLKLLDAIGCCAPGAPAMPAEAARTLAERFKALADPTRLAIVNQLAGANEVCVCHLVPDSELSQPTISHHLKLLRDAGLVTSERRGTWAYYRLVPEAVAELATALGAQQAIPAAAIVAAS